jgi:CheY-like chemotaxis protein/anti-sigma regulatory factor (Ser/Thr protein kinase)
VRHLCAELLREEGYEVHAVEDGPATLAALSDRRYDLLLLDIWMPEMNGLEVLSSLAENPDRPLVIVLTSDRTPETLLEAIREQAYLYLAKPVVADSLLSSVARALTEREEAAPIEVISATPYWLELEVPCSVLASKRIQNFVLQRGADLPEDIRESIAIAFYELLNNAIEWGGEFDPDRKVRIACLRSDRILLFRIADPGHGFDPEDLPHAAVGHEPGSFGHVEVRDERGIRPGGLGLLMVKGLVDELIYNEAHNEVVFIKYLHGADADASR